MFVSFPVLRKTFKKITCIQNLFFTDIQQYKMYSRIQEHAFFMCLGAILTFTERVSCCPSVSRHLLLGEDLPTSTLAYLCTIRWGVYLYIQCKCPEK